MNDTTKPAITPVNPRFSSGPCTKHPGWTPEFLSDAWLGRSHRAAGGKAKLRQAIDRTGAMLGVPDDYRIAIVPASDTGALEMAMWSMLGARGVQVLAWESFGSGWAGDVKQHLKIDDVKLDKVPYGDLPDLAAVDFSRDVIFTWNGTTSGVRVPNGDWIAADRQGLTFCDATSAAFAQALDWPKLDVTTLSWQKALGGEAQHGMLILSPRAIERLETYTPPWPLPKVFRLTKGGKLIEGVFRGETLNTPSLLATEDYLDALDWAENVGGLDALMARANANAKALSAWVETCPWVDFLAADPASRSNTSVCLKIIDPQVAGLPADEQAKFVKSLAACLEAEDAGYDIAGHRDAPPGLRIWCGSTVETADIKALTPWLDWGFAKVKAELMTA